MEYAETHEFHLVMGRRMKEKLKRIGIKEGSGSLSGIIVKIIEALGNFVKAGHMWSKEKMGRYMNVSRDKAEVREHVHVYLPRDVYKELKAIHMDLNIFSIAQIVRGILQFFLDLVDVYGGGVYGAIEEVYKAWKEEEDKISPSKGEILRQLLLFMLHFSHETMTITVYNKKFSPIRVFRL